ncbi:MAG: adenylate/guanylate cyclase domain-containing protein [Saprospiraceae bacterium]|nr:adenylate/guanylate cyclase domain-containing protein [Saprospiraceae bacterium]
MNTKAKKIGVITAVYLTVIILSFLYDLAVLKHFNAIPETFNIRIRLSTILFVGLFAGLTGGFIQVTFLEDWLRNNPYWKSLLYIVLAYSALFLVVATLGGFIYATRLSGNSFFHPKHFDYVLQQMGSPEYVKNFFLWFIVVLMTMIGQLVSDKYGPGVFKDFLLGKYFRPRREERIFMFLDLRSATTIAENLGEAHYFNLLRSLFKDITPSILDTHGEIYQYVGDEVVVTWKKEIGIEKAQCVSCFLSIQRALKSKSAWYQEVFGIVPEFKAGFHCGPVMVGEVGQIKKDIAFSGDVLNTTARIQSLCNVNNVDVLLSEHLLHLLPFLPSGKTAVRIGTELLRGKAQQTSIYTIQ